MKIEELQCEIGHRERHIKNLKDEIHDLKNNIERLLRELEAKGKEILKVRSDANLQIKYVIKMGENRITLCCPSFCSIILPVVSCI
jgi:predicted  nucleic acid-binding Zn-ribbon protein